MRFFRSTLLKSLALIVPALTCASHALAQQYSLPEFGFTEESESMGAAPSMAVYNGVLYIAFQANDSTQSLWIDSTVDGVTLRGATNFPNIRVGSTPTLSVYNGQLDVSFVSQNGSGLLFVCTTTNVSTFSCNQQNTNTLQGKPAMTVFNNDLFFAGEENNELVYSSTTNPAVFPASQTTFANNGSELAEYTQAPPGLTTFNGNLILGFVANDPSRDLFLQQNVPGTGWQPSWEYSLSSLSAPGLVTITQNGQSSILAAWETNNSTHNLSYASFTSASNGLYYSRQDSAQIGSAPAMAIFTPTTGKFANQPTLFVAFQSNDSSHRLWFGGQTIASFDAP